MDEAKRLLALTVVIVVIGFVSFSQYNMVDISRLAAKSLLFLRPRYRPAKVQIQFTSNPLIRVLPAKI